MVKSKWCSVEGLINHEYWTVNIMAQSDLLTDDEFIKALQGEDELGAVVRAHIDIEQHLNEIIILCLPYPEHLDKVKLEYLKKVNLVICFSLKKEYRSVLKAFGELRNKFAHKPRTQLDESLVTSFYESFSSTGKECVQLVFKKAQSSRAPKEKIPDFKKLSPKDSFILIAVAIRQMLKVAIMNLKDDLS